MIYDIDNLPKAFNLGRRGENLVTYIGIDCAAWLDEYEGATMGATIILPKQIEPVPLPIEMNDKIMTIPVTRSITSVAGKGSINIRLLGLNNEEKRSKVVGTNVDESHAAATGQMPDLVDAKNADTVDGKHASDLANAIHAHGNITNDGKIGTDSDKFLVTGAGGSIGVKTKQEAASLIGVSNPNILHNWDWRNPINQRSVTSFNREYGIDRWFADNSKEVTITESGLVILNGGWILQRLENRLGNKTVTVSVRTTDGIITSGTGIFPSTVNGRTDINRGRFNFILFCRSLYDEIVITPQTQDETVEAVKAEIDSNSTLHLDPPMDWAVEMPKCLRFFVNLKQKPILYGYRNTYTGTVFYLPLSVPMRIDPTFSSYSEIKIAAGNSWIPGTVSDIEMTNSGNLKVFIHTEQTIPEAPLIATISAGNNDITLSADL